MLKRMSLSHCGAILAVTVALTAAVGCAGRQRPEAEFWGQGGKRVAFMVISGNESFSDSKIKKGLQTPTRYHPLAMQLDEKRIINFYNQHGFFDAHVDQVFVKAIDKDTVGIRVVVHEGEPTKLARVEVKDPPVGPEAPSREQLDKKVNLKPGSRFDHQKYLDAKQAVRADLIEEGYAHARVDGRIFVDKQDKQALVELDLDPGPLTRFGPVKVEGNQRIPDQAIRNRIAWEEGEIYDPDKVAKTQNRLYGLGYFGSVSVNLEDEGRPAVASATIRVSEGTRHEVRFGGGLAADESRFEVRGRANYVVRSWLSPLVNFNLDARPGWTVASRSALIDNGFTGDITLSVDKHDFLLPRMRGRVETAYEFRLYEAYGTRGPRGRLAVERPLFADRLFLSGGWNATYLEVLPEEWIEEALGFEVPYSLSWFEQGIAVDFRDNVIDPHRGMYAHLRFEEGGFFERGLFSFARLTPEVRFYLPAHDRVVFASYIRVGALLSSSDTTPLTRRYFGGGASGHRGFATRHMSPMMRSPDGDLAPIGANYMLESSVEGRFDIKKFGKNWLGVVAFVDAGDATETYGALKPDNLHIAVGSGLRYDTIVGPIRFDLARRLNRLGVAGPEGLANPDPGDAWAFHLSIGEAF